ncbi:MAG TPA: hypothetical protein PK876_02165 [Elusimicrobiota bacterium]|nr:hypothetical protein [Elusimicrobiota bacterium]
MPIAANSAALIVLSLGLLGIIISFLITDAKRYLIALCLAGFIVLTGAYQFINVSIRQWQTARRIDNLQKQQRVNLEALQERLRAQMEAQNKQGAKAPAAAKK